MEKKSVYMTPEIEDMESRLACAAGATGASGLGGNESDDNTGGL
jgi:hypothetical protein